MPDLPDFSVPSSSAHLGSAALAQRGEGFALRLHVSILCVFVTLLLTTTGLTMYFLYHRMSDTLLLARGELFAQVALRAVERIDRTLRPLESIVELTARLESLAQDIDATNFHLTDLFIDMQRRYPQLASTYIGYANGDFARVIAIRGNVKIRERISAPAAAAYALQILLRPDHDTIETWTYFDGNGKMLGRTQHAMPWFDPRTRPWYRPALDADAVIKTSPYVFAATGETGFTLARKAMHLKGAVIGADVRLDEISAHLDSLQPTRNSDVVLFSASGELLVHNEVAKALDAQPLRKDSTLVPVHISNVNNPVLNALFAAIAKRLQPGTVTFDVKGVAHYGRVEKLTLQSSLDEYVAVVAPRSDLLGQAEQIRDRALLYSLLLLLIAIPAIAFAAWRIGRPLRELAAEAQRIQRFELDGELPLRSHITEIRGLTRSVAAMKSGLREFARYVPRTLVRDIVSGQISPHAGGERRTLTVLASDISNFTQLSERVPPEALMRQMSDYFSAMSHEIVTQGGTVDKFMGDAVMAFWNAPRPQDDHVLCGCRAALALRRVTAQLNTGWLAAGAPALPTRFGLHTGDAVVGNLGSDDRLSYTALGTVINTVFRIERLNRDYGTEILITDAVALACGSSFVIRAVDRVVPRGSASPILVHELLGARDEDGIAAQIELADHWQTVWTAYHQCDWPRAQALLQNIVAAFPDDKLSKIYLARVARHLIDPDYKDWDGVDWPT